MRVFIRTGDVRSDHWMLHLFCQDSLSKRAASMVIFVLRFIHFHKEEIKGAIKIPDPL